DPMKIGSKAQGYTVDGPVDRLPEICEEASADCEVIIAIPSANSGQMRRFVEVAEKGGLRYRTLPGLRGLTRRDVVFTHMPRGEPRRLAGPGACRYGPGGGEREDCRKDRNGYRGGGIYWIRTLPTNPGVRSQQTRVSGPERNRHFLFGKRASSAGGGNRLAF